MNMRNQKGFSLVELMMVIAISAFMFTGIFTALITGQATWFSADTAIELRTNIRHANEKMARELRQSGFDSVGTSQVTITDAGGANNSDILRFSTPVVCESTGSLLNATGDVANWGAALTWGCTTSTCMDADDNCATVDYKYVQYEVNASNQLLRKVLNPALTVIRQDIIASNIIDMQITTSVNQQMVTIVLSAQKQSAMHRMINLTKSVDVLLRNRG